VKTSKGRFFLGEKRKRTNLGKKKAFTEEIKEREKRDWIPLGRANKKKEVQRGRSCFCEWGQKSGSPWG